MSIGICLYNLLGVSLAADSSYITNSNDVEHIYNSARKIFKLTSSKPLAAVVYSDKQFFKDIQISQIIDEFSIYLDKSEPIRELKDILESFTNFLAKNETYYKFDKNSSRYAKHMIYELADEVAKHLNAFALDPNNYPFKEEINNLEDKIRNEIEFNIEIEGEPGIEKVFAESLIEDFLDYIKENNDETIYSIAKQMENKLKSLLKLVGQYYFFTEPFIPVKILFIGYGEDDASPVGYSINLYDIFEGHVLKSINLELDPYENDRTAYFMGDTNALDIFTDNIDGLVRDKLEETPLTIYKDALKEQDFLTDDKKSLLNDSFEAFSEDVSSDLYGKSLKETWFPLNSLIRDLPIPDLVELAGGLAKMSAFRAKYINHEDDEYIKEPIDIAYITKTEGFVWVKNKSLSLKGGK